MAGAIVSFGNIALELCVGQWMIFHFNGESLHTGIEAWPFGHRPAFQCIAYLQTKVVMTPARMMQLNDKDRRAQCASTRFVLSGIRFCSHREIASVLILA